MRITEFTKFSPKQRVFVIYAATVFPSFVIGPSSFQDNDYEVTLDTEFGGILHVREDQIWMTEREAKKALFKLMLKRNDREQAIHGKLQPSWTRSIDEITEGFMPYTDEQKEFIQTIYDALPEDSYDIGVNNNLGTLHEGGLRFEVEVKQEDELQPAVDKIIEIARKLEWQYNFASIGHYTSPLKARFSVMPMSSFIKGMGR